MTDALPPLAGLLRLASKLGLDSNTMPRADVLRAEEALEDASGLARSEAGQEWADGVAPAPVVTVVLQSAKRAYLNPEELSSQQAGPFSKRHGTVSAYLTEDERTIVRRFRKRNRGLWTQPTTRGEDGDTTLWMEDSFGFEPFPTGSVDEGVW
jgi:hypothetical protein